MNVLPMSDFNHGTRPLLLFNLHVPCIHKIGYNRHNMYLEDNPLFAIFVSLAKFAGLYAEIHEATGLTIMALPNEVFQRMEVKSYSRLINLHRDAIKDVIAHHIIRSEYKSYCLPHGSYLQAMNGSDLLIYNKNGVIRINNALVTTPDIRLRNGIAHAIDTLLAGPGRMVPPRASCPGQ